MVSRDEMLAFYRSPARMSEPGACAGMFEGLPGDVGALAEVVQGLLLHEHWAGAYGQSLTEDRRAGSHLRGVAAMLSEIRRQDPSRLDQARPVVGRLVGVCRHFSLMLEAMLRHQGRPARSRCGFGTYFEPGKGVDHWVCEYWNAKEGRWVMVDAQIDKLQRQWLKPDFDLLDVPRDRFLVAGQVWTACREGRDDASRFGIMDMSGLWFIAGNVLRDGAALNNMEMLPWDAWGAMPQPAQAIDEETACLLDRLARLTSDPDANFDELRQLFATDPRLTVPPVVFNVVANREDRV